ncbi:MAG: hydratase [Rubrivivax sp.]|nr:MAG: hydratase [Rubrivivax sp.]
MVSTSMEAARILAARRRSGEQGLRLPPSCRPLSLEAAFDIQFAVTDLLGERVGAWKCGLPSEGQLVAAPIHAGTVHWASPCKAWARDGQVRVEPELAFVLGHDLPPRDQPYTPAEVDAAIASTHLALELIDSRYIAHEAVNASFAEKLADGLVNQGLFIGPPVDGEHARLAASLPIQVSLMSGADRRHDGRHPNAQPRAPLHWLAEFLRGRGQGLLAGQAVITGSYAGSFMLPLDEDISIQYGDLGVVHVHFQARTADHHGEPPEQ